jgi:transcriptional regulator with XRE-family HTH domain
LYPDRIESKMSRKRNRSRCEVWMYLKNPEKMRRRRKDRRLTQVQLAALVGCTQQYISLLEQGDDRDVSERIAEEICHWLDVDLEDYFDEHRIARMPANATVSRGGRNTVRTPARSGAA